MVDPAHWAELPDGHTRATTVEHDYRADQTPDAGTAGTAETEDTALPAVRAEARTGFAVEVVHRPLTDYDVLAGLAPPGSVSRPTSAGQVAALVGAA